MTSPTQRSLARLKADGWTCGIVERFNPHVGDHGIRQDFCGGIDLIAFKEPSLKAHDIQRPPWIGLEYDGSILGVQACAASGLSSHRTKLLAEPRMREWVAAGGRLVIHSWGLLAFVKKNGKKGKARRWTCRETWLGLSDFPTDSAPAPSAASPEAS